MKEGRYKKAWHEVLRKDLESKRLDRDVEHTVISASRWTKEDMGCGPKEEPRIQRINTS